MKKIIISMFLVFSMLGFSRFVERCEITSKGIWRNGKKKRGFKTCFLFKNYNCFFLNFRIINF